MIWLPLLLALQPAPAQQTESVPAPWPDPEREMPGDGALTPRGNSLEAQKTLNNYAACVTTRSPEKAARLLEQDFRTTSYRNAMRELSRANEGCARRVGLRGSLRANGLPFAGALAEQLAEQSSEPLNIRLAKAIAGRTPATYGRTDEIAMCTVRSAPDDVAKLFATEAGSAEEAAAGEKVGAVAQLCSRNARLEIATHGLRAMLATASYRLLAAQDDRELP